MLARIRKSIDEQDEGFTLIELLVVMIIIGILAAIAIPVFLNQQQKARDTAVKSDTGTIAKELAALYVDGTGDVTYTAAVAAANGNAATPARITVSGESADLKLSKDSEIVTITGNQNNWCVAVKNKVDGADGSTFKYTVANGLEKAGDGTINAATACP